MWAGDDCRAHGRSHVSMLHTRKREIIVLWVCFISRRDASLPREINGLQVLICSPQRQRGTWRGGDSRGALRLHFGQPDERGAKFKKESCLVAMVTR